MPRHKRPRVAQTPGSRQRLLKRQRAQSLVELAFVLPVLMMLVFGIVDFGMGLHSWIVLTNSSREGARLAVVHAPSSGAIHCSPPLPAAGSIERKVCDTAANLKPANVTITVTNADPGVTKSGQPVTVKVDYQYDLITPFAFIMHLNSLTMSSTVQMRLE
jgi:Flp pilus assembly protein TadG